jgi:predicted nucleotidyltransferase
MDRLTLMHKRRQEILALATRHGARNVRVFGSVARGAAGPDSDKVDVVSQNGLKARIRSRVLQVAVPL